MAETTREPQASRASLSDLVALAARVACQGVGLLLIAIGTIYAVSVFSTVAAMVKDPQGLEAPVRAVARTIGAEKLAIAVNGQALEAGGTVAMTILLLWYFFLAWIPLAIVKTGGKLIYWTLQAGSSSDRGKNA